MARTAVARSRIVGLLAALGASPAASAAACWDRGGFERAEWRFCHQVQEDLLVYYGPNGTDVKLGLHAEGFTGGWSALALGGNGGMKGAHQLVVRQVDGEWVAEDRHSIGYAQPAMDAKQDVTLLFAREESGSTSWAVQVPTSNCDPDDFPIQNLSQWIHWARGPSHDFVYHGHERGQFHLNLLAGPPPGVDLTGTSEVDIRMPNVSVVGDSNGTDPKNPYICGIFDLEALSPGMNASLKHHVVKFAPYLDPGSSSYVHHIILFSCKPDSPGLSHNSIMSPCERMPKGCYSMKWVWAVGSQDLVMPPNVGMPIGGGRRWMTLQVHYYNPQLVPNIWDSSGVRIFVADTLRPVDAGVFQFNGGILPARGGAKRYRPGERDPLPAGQRDLHIPSLLIPPACTRSWTSDISVFAIGYHGHLSGKRFDLAVSRDGSYLGTMRHEPLYDFTHQSVEEPAVATIRPGDELLFQCSYNTSSRSSNTSFGDLTQEEMCFGVFMFYPAQAMRMAVYMEPVQMKNPLPFFQQACSRESTAPAFRGESECVQLLMQDPLAILDVARLGGRRVGGPELCNSFGQRMMGVARSFYNQLCPPCRSATCTEAEIREHAKSVVCPHICSQYGMSLWPDTSRRKAKMPTHYTYCQGLGPTKSSPTVSIPRPDGGYCVQQQLQAISPSIPSETAASSATQFSTTLAHGLVGTLVLHLAK